jgi:hypothetical protein
MPKGKKRQRAASWDWEASGAEENYMNDADSTNNRVGAVEVCEGENDNGDSHAADPVNGANAS